MDIVTNLARELFEENNPGRIWDISLVERGGQERSEIDCATVEEREKYIAAAHKLILDEALKDDPAAPAGSC